VPLAPRDALAVRHLKLRESIRAAKVDALVVTHLPNLLYLTNFAGTAGIAVVTAERLFLILDFRYRSAVDELQASPHGSPNTEIVPVDRSYDEALVALLRKLGLARVGVEGANLSVVRCYAIARSLGASIEMGEATVKGAGATTLVSTDGIVEGLRIKKDDHEIEMLRRGGLLLSAVALDVLQDMKAGVKERKVAAKIDWRIKSAGFERCAFETIVASGPNAALPHAHAGERELRQGDLVVLDFGGVYGGYCVDLTRTVAIGKADAEMQRVYGAVLEAQNAAIAAARAGVRAGDIDAAARETLGRHRLAEAFGHSTGHGLGVEIHEAPRVGPRREATGDAPTPADDPIEPGMVFTIEPGAYIPGWGGVRIEDDVLVTGEGVELLTNVPRDLDLNARSG
jgi:Xaa-Pro aminopeptidase